MSSAPNCRFDGAAAFFMGVIFEKPSVFACRKEKGN